MSRGFTSMTALLGLLAIAGYQNREGLRLAEMAYLSEGQIPEEVGHGAVL